MLLVMNRIAVFPAARVYFNERGETTSISRTPNWQGFQSADILFDVKRSQTVASCAAERDSMETALGAAQGGHDRAGQCDDQTESATDWEAL
jgi:hypothetical protein